MTPTAEDHLTLKLVGYVSHTSFGFVLPLFGQYDRANTLYVADCSPSGDHGGKISRFNTYESVSHTWLPVERPDPIRIGDSWIDVFLWNDRVLIGDPQTLWEQLAPFKADLQQLAPLSLLDAAMYAAAPDRDLLAPAAMAYVADRFGVDRANYWREGTLRRHVSVLVRRVIPEFQEASTADTHALSIDARTVHLTLPESLLGQLQKVGALEPLVEDTRRLAVSLHLDFELRSREAPSIPKGSKADVAPSSVESRSNRDAGTVLILTIGRRAREVARHIEDPTWLPVDRPYTNLHDSSPVEAHGTNRIVQVINGDDPRVVNKIATGYGVVVALIDDSIAIDEGLAIRYRELLEEIGSRGAVRILAPALPEPYPSILLCGSYASPLRDWFRSHALLDTSQARSPFWWGSPRRSLDRRIADIISGAAGLCLSSSISKRLQSDSAHDELMMFAIDLESERRPHDDPQTFLGSESTWPTPHLSKAEKSSTKL